MARPLRANAVVAGAVPHYVPHQLHARVDLGPSRSTPACTGFAFLGS